MSQFSHYVDPRLNEDLLTEGISDIDLPSVSLPKKTVEAAAPVVDAAAEAAPSGPAGA